MELAAALALLFQDDAGRAPLAVGVRWLFFGSVVGMLGVPAFRIAVLDRLAGKGGLGPAARSSSRRLRTVAAVTAVLALVVVPLRLQQQAALLFDDDWADPGLLGALLSSGWGSQWILHGSMAVLFLLGFLLVWSGRFPDRGWRVMLAGGLGAALVPALSGHSAAVEGSGRSWAILSDALHVVGASVWVGGLGCLVLSLGPFAAAEASEGHPPPLSALVDRFSRVALPAVGVLLATGVVNAWFHVDGPAAIFSTAWGRTLLVKVTLVGIAGALGLYNWRVVRPALRRTPRTNLIRIPASVELLAALGVLWITAMLVAVPPE